MRYLPCLTAIFLTFAATPVWAEWFHDFDNGIPDAWQFFVPPPVVNSDSDTWSASETSGYLLLAEERSINDGGAGVISSVETSELFTDVRVSGLVNIDPQVGSFMGLTVNTINTAGPGGYLFGIETAPSADVGTVWLARGGAGGLVQWGSERDYGIATRLDPESSYFMQLDVQGNLLTGTVFDEEGGTELIRISQQIDNPIPAPRQAGVYADSALGFERIPSAGTFDNVSAVAIPEPSSLFLVLAGLPLLRISRSRRR